MRAIVKVLFVTVLVSLSQNTSASSGGVAIVFMTMEGCAIVSDNYKHRADKIVSEWKEDNPDLYQKFNKYSKSDSLSPNVRGDIEKLAGRELNDFKTECENMLSGLEKAPEPTDKRFSSPGKTWDLFVQSLIAGDKEMIAKCLYGRAYENYASFFSSETQAQLNEMGKSFSGFEIISDMGNLQEAVITRSNGRAGTVLFIKLDENWKISRM